MEHVFPFDGEYEFRAPGGAVLMLDGVKISAGRVPVTRLGHTGGDVVAVSGDRPVLLSTLSRRHESWFPDYMSGTDG